MIRFQRFDGVNLIFQTCPTLAILIYGSSNQFRQNGLSKMLFVSSYSKCIPRFLFLRILFYNILSAGQFCLRKVHACPYISPINVMRVIDYLIDGSRNFVAFKTKMIFWSLELLRITLVFPAFVLNELCSCIRPLSSPFSYWVVGRVAICVTSEGDM